MAYKVIMSFTDLQDDNHIYEVGDTFPRKGVKASLDRVKELMGSDNKRGVPLIEEKPSKTSNKSKKGKSNARKDS